MNLPSQVHGHPNLSDWYGCMFLIRRVEETLLELYSKGVLFGTTHTCIGQEADAVGVVSQLQPQDVIFSNHRCHGHYLARFGDAFGLFSELMGRESGICGGIGGSQHLCAENFYTNGIQGGIVPQITGIALAEKVMKRGSVSVVFIGDGTLGEGVVYEAWNIASLWNLPVLYVIEHNGYAQSTPSALQLAGDVAARPRAFGIETVELDSTAVEEIAAVAGDMIERIRCHQKPGCLILHTYRFSPHSKGDDFRDPLEIVRRRELDPLTLLRPRVPAAEEIERAVERQIVESVERALKTPLASRLQPV